jgi:cardiolipin synthase
MNQGQFTPIIFLALHIFIQTALIVRVLLRPHREPASRIAWSVVILAVPFLGIMF